MMNDYILSKHAEQTENCEMKIGYKICASRRSLTHCNMMHGTYNVKKKLDLIMILALTPRSALTNVCFLVIFAAVSCTL
jgi:hypothetical protein